MSRNGRDTHTRGNSKARHDIGSGAVLPVTLSSESKSHTPTKLVSFDTSSDIKTWDRGSDIQITIFETDVTSSSIVGYSHCRRYCCRRRRSGPSLPFWQNARLTQHTLHISHLTSFNRKKKSKGKKTDRLKMSSGGKKTLGITKTSGGKKTLHEQFYDASS
jgi:hypothetical protein